MLSSTTTLYKKGKMVTTISLAKVTNVRHRVFEDGSKRIWIETAGKDSSRVKVDKILGNMSLNEQETKELINSLMQALEA
jgi:hypothetical protein